MFPEVCTSLRHFSEGAWLQGGPLALQIVGCSAAPEGGPAGHPDLTLSERASQPLRQLRSLSRALSRSLSLSLTLFSSSLRRLCR